MLESWLQCTLKPFLLSDLGSIIFDYLDPVTSTLLFSYNEFYVFTQETKLWKLVTAIPHISCGTRVSMACDESNSTIYLLCQDYRDVWIARCCLSDSHSPHWQTTAYPPSLLNYSNSLQFRLFFLDGYLYVYQSGCKWFVRVGNLDGLNPQTWKFEKIIMNDALGRGWYQAVIYAHFLIFYIVHTKGIHIFIYDTRNDAWSSGPSLENFSQLANSHEYTEVQAIPLLDQIVFLCFQKGHKNARELWTLCMETESWVFRGPPPACIVNNPVYFHCGDLLYFHDVVNAFCMTLDLRTFKWQNTKEHQSPAFIDACRISITSRWAKAISKTSLKRKVCDK